MGVLTLEVEVWAAAVGYGGDEFASFGVAHSCLEAADGDFPEGACCGIRELGVSEGDFKDEGVGFRGAGGFVEEADGIGKCGV